MHQAKNSILSLEMTSIPVSPEHHAFCEHRDLLVSTISQDPQGIGDKMQSKFLISEDFRDELGLATLTRRAKARMIADRMSDLVKHKSEYFDKFLEFFESAGLWTGDLVEALSEARTKYTKLSSEDGLSPAKSSIKPYSKFPDLSLTVLTEELRTVTDPKLLGIGLGIETHVVQTIEKNNRGDINGQKMDLFSYIADNHSRLGITWLRIAEVLKDLLHKGNLADDIRRRLVY